MHHLSDWKLACAFVGLVGGMFFVWCVILAFVVERQRIRRERHDLEKRGLL